ncbi:hypothetical protein PG991_012087 [Apiospora marii]|uniref:Uncharacterized protein n=1 Tax=Apiospora marii TaxID=335849 RepID=A0ABR1RG13_9PEZI
MAHQHILITPPSEEAILNHLVEHARAWNAREPQNIGLNGWNFDAEIPLLLNPEEAPFACREPPAVFEAINAQFSAQVHAIFGVLQKYEVLAETEPDLIRQADGLQPAIRVGHQSFDYYPDCPHRAYHTRRLTVQDIDRLPPLRRVRRLRVCRGWTLSDGLGRGSTHMRPASPRVPLDLVTRCPDLRELDCPWLWERLPIAFSSRALRRFARVWEGPWRDSRIEFARGVRDVLPRLPASLAKARLWFWHFDVNGGDADQAEQMPNLVGTLTSSSPSGSEFGGKDPVSLGLRDLGRRLEELDVRALITPDLFATGRDDDEGLTDDNLPSWPRMRHLKVEFHPCAPDGRWYFSGPRGEDPHGAAGGFAITTAAHYPPTDDDGLHECDEGEATHALWAREQEEHELTRWEEDIWDTRAPDMFRTRPIAARIEPLLLAFASSLRRGDMPVLEDAQLFAWLAWRPSKARAQAYKGSEDAPPCLDEVEEDEVEYEFEGHGVTTQFRWGVRYEAPNGGAGNGKVTWQVGEDWRPGTIATKPNA